MKSVEVLLTKGSALRHLKTSNITKLRIVDISNTFVSALPIQYIPELQQLEIQGSMVMNLYIRGNVLFQRISFGPGQCCSVNPCVSKYFNEIRILSEGFPAVADQYCTQKYIVKELVSMGIGHYADLEGDLIEFNDNLVTT